MTSNKMKNEKYNTVPTIPNINIKIVERGKFDIRTTQINNTLLGTVTSIKSCEVKLIMHDEPTPPCSW